MNYKFTVRETKHAHGGIYRVKARDLTRVKNYRYDLEKLAMIATSNASNGTLITSSKMLFCI